MLSRGHITFDTHLCHAPVNLWQPNPIRNPIPHRCHFLVGTNLNAKPTTAACQPSSQGQTPHAIHLCCALHLPRVPTTIRDPSLKRARGYPSIGSDQYASDTHKETVAATKLPSSHNPVATHTKRGAGLYPGHTGSDTHCSPARDLARSHVHREAQSFTASGPSYAIQYRYGTQNPRDGDYYSGQIVCETQLGPAGAVPPLTPANTNSRTTCQTPGILPSARNRTIPTVYALRDSCSRQYQCAYPRPHRESNLAVPPRATRDQISGRGAAALPSATHRAHTHAYSAEGI